MAHPLALELHASGEETTSGTGTVADVRGTDELPRGAVRLLFEVSAIAGASPDFVAELQTSPSPTGPWVKVAAFVSATEIGFGRLATGVERYIRAAWTLSAGTTSVSFKLTGEAHLVFATTDDLPLMGPPKEALASQTDSAKAMALIAASDLAIGYVAGAHATPLKSWGLDLTRATAAVASWDLVFQRGFKPTGPDELFEKRYRDAIKWLEGVRDNEVSMPDIVDATPDEVDGAAAVESLPRRGWGE